jgi:ribosomal protein L37AE/L43A
MPFSCSCPRCRRAYRFRTAQLRQIQACAQCGAEFVATPQTTSYPISRPAPAPEPLVRTEPLAIQQDSTAPCPYCREPIQREARKCKHCGEMLDGSRSAHASARATVVVYHEPRGFDHSLHLIMTLVTCGMWLPVWILCAIVSNGQDRRY